MCGPPPEEALELLTKGKLGEEDFIFRVWVQGFADYIEDHKAIPSEKPNPKGNLQIIKTNISDLTIYNTFNRVVDYGWVLEKNGKYYITKSLGGDLKEDLDKDPYEGFEILGTIWEEDWEEVDNI